MRVIRSVLRRHLKWNRKEKKGPTGIWTRIREFKVLCDNRLHYRTAAHDFFPRLFETRASCGLKCAGMVKGWCEREVYSERKMWVLSVWQNAWWLSIWTMWNQIHYQRDAYISPLEGRGIDCHDAQNAFSTPNPYHPLRFYSTPSCEQRIDPSQNCLFSYRMSEENGIAWYLMYSMLVGSGESGDG